MSDILNDIIDDVVIKPNKTKIIVKWILRIAVFAVVAAFIIGQFKVTAINKINEIEKNGNDNKKAILDLENEMKNRFDKVDEKIESNNEKIESNNDRIDAIYEKIINK